MSVSLHEVVPWGRSLDEYRRMFALTNVDLAGEILGCGDGPASFNAEAVALGHCVVSCDPIYAFSSQEIERRVHATYDELIAQVKRSRDHFIWEQFRDPDHLGECRLAAMRTFLDDYHVGRGQGRYVTASLPRLPFADGRFNLALCSHLLFLYSEQLDLDFHVASLEGLLRVAGEVRVFPLLGLDGRESRYLPLVLAHLAGRGWRAEVERVPYEFQKGGDQMLRIR